MQKILIIGAGVEQVGVIKLAKEMGIFVIVTDMNPKAPGIKYADKFYEVSTTDSKGNERVGKLEKINGVMTVCSETAVPTVANVAEKLNLPGFLKKTALLATNKAKMRNVLVKNGITVSPFLIANTIDEVKAFTKANKPPWVFKPVDSSGQRGTSQISRNKDIEKAFLLAKENSATKQVLLDKFIKGPEVHVTMQVINKTVYYLAISDRITLDEKKFGIAVRHIGPSNLDKKLSDKIKQLCKKSIDAIELENGVATCEIIIEDNNPYLMEIAIRVPGGYLRELALYLSGIDIYKTTIWNCLGINKKYDDLVTNKKYNAVSIKFISSLNLNNNIKVIEEVNKETIKNENVQAINFHFKENFIVPKLENSVGRFAVIITTGDTIKNALILTEKIFEQLRFNKYELKEYTSYSKYNINFKIYLTN